MWIFCKWSFVQLLDVHNLVYCLRSTVHTVLSNHFVNGLLTVVFTCSFHDMDGLGVLLAITIDCSDRLLRQRQWSWVFYRVLNIYFVCYCWLSSCVFRRLFFPLPNVCGSDTGAVHIQFVSLVHICLFQTVIRNHSSAFVIVCKFAMCQTEEGLRIFIDACS